ncbi:MAG: putative glutathione S-transferase, partial [Myxococcota bacterium]
EVTLDGQRFLGGQEPGAVDWALYAILVRFDAIFYGLFKLNRQRLADFPALGGWLRDLYQRPGVAGSLDLAAVVREVYQAHTEWNPKQTWPVFLPDHDAPHDRGRFDREARRAAGVEESGAGKRDGEFVRGRSALRQTISEAEAEPGRYHLYVANNCPWCHRAVLARSVLGLEDVVSMDTLYYRRDAERGWQFRPDLPGFDADSVHNARFIREIYDRQGSKESSVPILYDKLKGEIVNNESSEIIRIFDGAFRRFARHPTICPDDLRDEIDGYNAWIWRDINNGAYKAGFTGSQEAYEAAAGRYFSAFDRLEQIFSRRRFLCGERFTEADLRLFPTLYRHDDVYYTRFKLSRTLISETVHLRRWLEDVLSIPGVVDASFLEQCKQGYFGRHANEIVPIGPARTAAQRTD